MNIPEISRRTIFADTQVRTYVTDVLTRYHDVVGQNFDKKFLTPMNDFLESNEVFVEYAPEPHKLVVSHDFDYAGIAKDAKLAFLVNSSGDFLQIPKFEKGGAQLGVTRNDAAVGLFGRVLTDNIRYLNENPLKMLKFRLGFCKHLQK